MRLEKIVLNGFKSFADKTEFLFDAPMTAIVGPNGCGKSNVVDAIKWVLGDQSAKSLRSGQMADVIFSGSSNRKGLGAAEVSLFMSGSQGLGTKDMQIQGDELQVSRKIYKSGESEYRINGKMCRLRDIRELFMDTGIGVQAYSIIEQGQVEQLLNASKQDRRAIFEEAAGISKYKSQKKEALRKLDRTEQNLLRLADILGEVQKQLRSVKLQAGKARNYLAYTEELKELQIKYSLAEYDKIAASTKQKKELLGKFEQEYACIAAEVSKEDNQLTQLEQDVFDTEGRINHADNALVSVRSKIEQRRQRIEFLQARTDELQQRQANAAKRIENLEHEKRVFQGQLEKHKEEETKCQSLLQQRTAEVERLTEQIQQVNSEVSSLETELEDEKSGIIDIVRRTAQLHNELQSIGVHRDNLANQKDRLAGRAETARAELEQLFTAKAQNGARLEDIEKVLTELDERLKTQKEKAEDVSQRITQSSEQLSRQKESRSALESELAVLRDMETNRQGLNKAVKTILKNRSVEQGRFEYVRDMLAEILAADVEHAAAVEAALEGKAAALLVSSAERLIEDAPAICELEGRANFVLADCAQPFVDCEDLREYDCVRGRLIEFVSFDSAHAQLAWKLLGKTLVVDSIGSAIRLWSALGHKGYDLVTAAGEYVGKDGTVSMGPLGKAGGLISRKSRIRQIQENINSVNEQIAEITQSIDADNQSKEHLNKLCQELRTSIYEATTEKTQVNSRLGSLEQDINRLRKEQPLLDSEIDQLEQQISQSVEKEYNSKQKLDELEQVNQQRQAHIDELQERFAAKKELQQEYASKLTDMRVSLGQVREQSKAAAQAIENLQSQLATNRRSAESGLAEIEDCKRQYAQGQRDILACESEISELYIEKEQSQQQSRTLHEKLDELMQQKNELKELIRQQRQQETEVEKSINQLRIELSQLEVRQQSLQERVQDELQMDLVEAYKGYEPEETDWEAVKEKMTELRTKIERLGSVNVDAIENQEHLEQRNEFLAGQVEDLNKSKDQLEQLINRLNKQSREKFAETFELIRGHFQELFRKLFGGGRADIVLEDSDDILEAGIEVRAKPPGKETRSISLLSGGEKTLTAIGLLFAVFRAKPSPFCLLDEVDAALDEANVERFNIILKEFQKDSQFIVVTHNKRTMSIADVLFGVTMQTRGISKKISVRFDEVETEAQVA